MASLAAVDHGREVLAAKVALFDSDPVIAAACEAAGAGQLAEATPAFSAEVLEAIRGEDFSALLASHEGRHHELADQLMVELILGV